ncbi:Permease of the drug/metabolite transporter (DMT) superfamily [Halopelagius inordinatus]|uniref:Permease of the drug/metabolite transporter (DMT) superfamily n=1 Tax=Halopelagius inordinatus TaxID=553467 RepID=A0A1I2UW70_9EURY|nr:DMT family transporter [Halopelagius inordinatus]SFG81193.1 Permease of the drug/metabolite transporter (DMT) superfamily [Halopelagius inordinatus]
MSRQSPAVSPLLALSVAVLAVSTSAILVRFSEAPSLVKAFYRVLFTVSLLAPVAFSRSRESFRAFGRRDALVAVAAGVALAVHFASWFESLEWTSVAASVTLVQAQPLFVAVGAWALLNERITRGVVAGICVALVGMVTMTLGDLFFPALFAGLPGSLGALYPGGAAEASLSGEAPLYGDALAVVGAVTAAGYVLAGRSLRQRMSLIPYVTVVYGVCALVLLALTVASGHALVGYPPREWLLFLGMAVGPGVVGHTVINWALAHLESSVVSVSLLGEPVGSTVLALVLLAEVPTPATVVGGAVVLCGIYVAAARRSGVDADVPADDAPRPTSE